MLHSRNLIDYYPEVLSNVREFQAICISVEPELNHLWSAIKTALDDQFVLTASEYAVKRWEKILSITPKASYTLRERRFSILTRLAEQLPFSYRMLEVMLSNVCGADGFEIDLNTEIYTLTVRLALTAVNNFDDVDRMLERVCPANLILVVEIRYNQWFKFRSFTWDNLRSKTWRGLKHDVL